MCRRAICERCKKVTWAGCGAHVDAVMKGVPPEERCRCTPKEKEEARKQAGWWPF